MKYLLLFIYFVKLSFSFNIDTQGETKLIRPAEREGSTFFGYDLSLRNEFDDSLSLIVGAPKTKATTTSGGVHSCPVSTGVSLLPGSKCYSYPSPPFVETNSTSLGLSLEVENSYDVMACYPSSIFLCSETTQVVPGFCFRTNSDGVEWRQLRKDNSSICPRKLGNLDLLFVIDGSTSVGRTNFRIIQRWIKVVASNFDIRDGSTKIGVILYSTYDEEKSLLEQTRIMVNIELGEVRSQEVFDDRVDGIRYLSGLTYTAQALNRAVLEFQNSSRFSNSNTSKVLVLLTDGRASDSTDLPIVANRVRSLGIKTIAVGVGRIVLDELRVIASGTNTNEGVFFVNDFNALDGIANQLQSVIRGLAVEGSGSGDFNSQLELGEAGFSVKKSDVNIHNKK